jgi:hypothetical protein
VPEHPGEVRFATDTLRRNDREIMLVPLTRDEAEEKHRSRQHYVLFTRLPGGNVLVLHHHTGWSPHDPEQPRNPDFVPTRQFRLEIYGALGRLQTQFWEHYDRPGVLEMWSLTLIDRIKGHSTWQAHNDFKEETKSIHNHRAGQDGHTSRSMTASDLSLCVFAEPPFGEFNGLWERVSRYLENEGFGSFS